MNRKLTCILCPRGCTLEVSGQPEDLSVSGNSCPKGKDYAISECLHPTRTVTALVRIANRENTMVSVKTETPVPKGKMMDVIAMLHQVRLEAPVKIGDVVLADAFGSRVIVTKDIA